MDRNFALLSTIYNVYIGFVYYYCNKVYYIRKRVFVNVFFTEVEADKFIARNHYHYTKEVHTYVNCLWRNPEMEFIREMIMSGKLDNITSGKTENTRK